MIENCNQANIRIFVFGTLRIGERLDFYMDGSKPCGLYYTQGQLMKAENGSVYIDFSYKNAVTIGELHVVNFYCLQRINHLEAVSGEFPKGYDLAILPIWRLNKSGEFTFKEEDKTIAFFYRRRNEPVKILGGDYTLHLDPIKHIRELLRLQTEKFVTEEEIIQSVNKLLEDVEF